MSDNGSGTLEVGTNDKHEVVINLPRDMTGHIVFSVQQARELADTLHKKANAAAAAQVTEDELARIAAILPVDRSRLCSTSGEAPEKVRAEQTETTGQHKSYIVLCEDERRKGFVRPYRDAYKHVGRAEPVTDDVGIPPHTVRRVGGCGTVTTMGRALSETYARDPTFYGATFCCGCNRHLPVASSCGPLTVNRLDRSSAAWRRALNQPVTDEPSKHMNERNDQPLAALQPRSEGTTPAAGGNQTAPSERCGRCRKTREAHGYVPGIGLTCYRGESLAWLPARASDRYKCGHCGQIVIASTAQPAGPCLCGEYAWKPAEGDALQSWELTRVVKLIQDEIDSRHSYPGTRGNPIGNPADIDIFEKAIGILRSHLVARSPGAVPEAHPHETTNEKHDDGLARVDGNGSSERFGTAG
jgi:hypothetical protein